MGLGWFGENMDSNPLLAKRIGLDTVAKLEAAASRRFEEAESLRQNGRLTGAVYLYGYVAEVCLVAAYFRLIGYRPSTEITRDQRNKALSEARQLKLLGFAQVM